jgi:hypothetical protein
LFGGAAGRVALDDEYLRFGGIALLAIGEFARQASDVERALATRQLPRFARGLARLRRLQHFADDCPRVLRVLLEPLGEQLVDEPLDHRPNLGRYEFVLGLRGEFRVGGLDREHAGEALAAIVAGEVDLFFLGQP